MCVNVRNKLLSTSNKSVPAAICFVSYTMWSEFKELPRGGELYRKEIVNKEAFVYNKIKSQVE